MGRTYTCDDCGGTFEAVWSEEDALAEKQKLWGDVPLEDCAQICDECFQRVSPENNPEEYERYLASQN